MTRYQQRRRTDNTEKRMLTIDDIEFLTALQKEMNEQDTLGQADPRFWVIRGSEVVYGNADGDPCICSRDSKPIIGMEECAKAVDQELKRQYGRDGNRAVYHIAGYIDVFIDDEETDTLFNIDDVATWMNEHGMDVWANTIEEVPRNYDSTLFLTMRDAENHLESNYYHYSDDARPYAMTAWRDPTLRKLYEILHEICWEAYQKEVKER